MDVDSGRALEQDFRLAGVVDDDGADPVDAAGAFDAPDIFACVLVDGNRERLADVFHTDQKRVARHGGGGGHADVVADGRVIPDEGTIPHEVTVMVVADEVAGCEQSVDTFSVGNRGWGGHVGFLM